MGFSVSGSAAIIFVAAFIGFGMFYTASANSIEQINDARADQADRTLDQQNTDIEIVAATWDADGNGDLDVEVENTGATGLSVADTDLLVDGVYRTGYSTSVEGDSDTDVWAPQQTLSITVTTLSTQPSDVKVVTENGVADTGVVS
jgi:flagellar protein FlaF